MNIFENFAERFENEMRWIWIHHSDDPEVCHKKMDDLMCQTLEEIGCEKGVEIFKKTERYYA